MTVLTAISLTSFSNPVFPGFLCCSYRLMNGPDLFKHAPASGFGHFFSSRWPSPRCAQDSLPQVHRSLSGSLLSRKFSPDFPVQKGHHPAHITLMAILSSIFLHSIDCYLTYYNFLLLSLVCLLPLKQKGFESWGLFICCFISSRRNSVWHIESAQ